MIQIKELVGGLNAAAHIGLPVMPVAQAGPYDWGWGPHPMMWGAWGIGMMLMMIVFWALVIAVIVVALRWALGQGKEPKADASLDILRQRYARGEINQDEFESKKKTLGG